MEDLQLEINAIQSGWHVMEFGDGIFVLFPYRSDGTLGLMAYIGTHGELVHFVEQKVGVGQQ